MVNATTSEREGELLPPIRRSVETNAHARALPRKTVRSNGFKAFATREHMEEAVLALCRPMLERVRFGEAGVKLGVADAVFSGKCQRMEGLCRLLWGLAPLVADGRASIEAELVRDGIVAGTDERHSEFWGWPDDYDQRLVELTAVAFALLIAPRVFWQPLSRQERANVAAVLGAANDRKCRDNNWLLFRILANLALARVDAPHSRRHMAGDWGRVDSFYLGRGWYSDGPGAQCDYYAAFGLHFYSLLYAKFAVDIDPLRAVCVKERAAEFAEQFVHWFSCDGSAVPYGRSLSYRCAQSAFWAALACSEPQLYSTGVAKGVVLRNLRWWFGQPIVNEAGLLSIGYGYANPLVAENYTSSSSPYWALKAFLTLSLPTDHPFWTIPEEPLPSADGCYVQRAPRALVCRDGAHVFVMPGAATVPTQHRNAPEKYAKFCYSNQFGFSLPTAPRSLGAGAHDSMLALSTDGDYYRVRTRSTSVRVLRAALVFSWRPWPDVQVTTWLVPVLPWHVRVHRVRTPMPLFSSEGGYALRLAEDDEQAAVPLGWDSRHVAAASSNGAFSAIADLSGQRAACLVRPDVNTNVLYRRTVIPSLVAEHSVGESWLACAVAGKTGEHQLSSSAVPGVILDANSLVVSDWTGRMVLRVRVKSFSERKLRVENAQ